VRLPIRQTTSNGVGPLPPRDGDTARDFTERVNVGMSGVQLRHFPCRSPYYTFAGEVTLDAHDFPVTAHTGMKIEIGPERSEPRVGKGAR